MTYPTRVLECSKETIFVVRKKSIVIKILNGDKKRWPDIQILPHRSSIRAEKLEVKTAW